MVASRGGEIGRCRLKLDDGPKTQPVSPREAACSLVLSVHGRTCPDIRHASGRVCAKNSTYAVNVDLGTGTALLVLCVTPAKQLGANMCPPPSSVSPPARRAAPLSEDQRPTKRMRCEEAGERPLVEDLSEVDGTVGDFGFDDEDTIERLIAHLEQTDPEFREMLRQAGCGASEELPELVVDEHSFQSLDAKINVTAESSTEDRSGVDLTGLEGDRERDEYKDPSVRQAPFDEASLYFHLSETT